MLNFENTEYTLRQCIFDVIKKVLLMVLVI